MNRRSTYLAPDRPARVAPAPRPRRRFPLLGLVAAVVAGLVLTGGLTLAGAQQSEAAQRTQIARCAKHLEGATSGRMTSRTALRARLAICRARLLAQAARRPRGTMTAGWPSVSSRTPGGTTSPVSSAIPTRTGPPSHTATPPLTATPSITDTPTASDTPTTTGTPTSTDTPSASGSPTASDTPTTSDSPSSTGTPTASGSPSTTGSASDTPTPTAPSTSGSALPVAGGFTAAFGAHPSSSAVTCNGQSNVTISGQTFTGIGNDQPAITIKNCSNVTITQNDFIDDAEPIYVVNSTNVTISYNRYRNITGPHQRNGSHRGNFTQWENSTGGAISHNVGVGGDTEDIISIYKSGGTSSSDPLVIEDNWFQGTNWTSSSGSGMMLGDGGGSHVVVRNNTLVNPGQVGIGVSGGSDIHVTGNTILGQARASSNVGIYVWGQGVSCSAIEVANNTVDWKKASGVVSGGWDGGTCGTITGWSSNAFSASLSFDALQVTL